MPGLVGSARNMLRLAVSVVGMTSLTTSMSVGQGVGAPAVPGPSHLAPTVTLGDGTIDGTRLTPYDNAWVVTQTGGGRVNEPGIWTDQLRVREIGGRKALVRTQGFVYSNGRAIWSVNVLDPTTLAPISSEAHQADGSVTKVSVNGLHVQTRTTPAGSGATEQARDFDLPRAAYDFNSNMQSFFPAALPLRLGYSAVLPAIPISPGDDSTTAYSVLRREKVVAGARGEVDAWVVEFANPGCCYIHFWITDNPRRIVRMTLSAGPGRPYEQSFDMIR